jgi:hypothetical protein
MTADVVKVIAGVFAGVALLLGILLPYIARRRNGKTIPPPASPPAAEPSVELSQGDSHDTGFMPALLRVGATVRHINDTLDNGKFATAESVRRLEGKVDDNASKTSERFMEIKSAMGRIEGWMEAKSK